MHVYKGVGGVTRKGDGGRGDGGGGEQELSNSLPAQYRTACNDTFHVDSSVLIFNGSKTLRRSGRADLINAGCFTVGRDDFSSQQLLNVDVIGYIHWRLALVVWL